MSVFTHQGTDYTINDPNIADEFSTGTSYVIGDHVTYQGNLYVFTSNHAAGAWNSGHVSQMKIGNELTGKIQNVKELIANEFSTSTAYTVGDYVTYSGNLYVFTANHAAGAWSFNDVDSLQVGEELKKQEENNAYQDNYQNASVYQFSEKNTGNVVLKYHDFELGTITINNTVPSYPSSTSKIRTKQGTYYSLLRNTIINFNDLTNYNLYYIKYYSEGHASSGQISSVPFVITESNNYGFVISKKNDTKITSVADVISGLSVVLPVTNDTEYKLMENEDYNTPISFVVGSVSGDGLLTTTATRCRSESLRVTKGTIISIDYNITYDIQVAFFNDDMTIIDTSAWNKVVVVPQDCICFIIGRREDSGNISSTDIANIVATLKVILSPKNYYWEKYPSLYGIAHSGGSYGPRNTVPAYIEAFRHGFRHVETDVAMTADNVFVCIHGETINTYARNPDGSEIEETLYVYDLTYDELLEYDFGIYYSQEYAGTKIARLDEVADICSKLGMDLFVDIKDYPLFTQEQIKALMDTVDSCGMQGHVTYCCALLAYAEYVYKTDKTANISCIFSASQWFRVLRFYSGKNAVSLNSTYSTVTAERIANCKAYKIPMITGMLNTEEELEAADPYLSGIVSDSLCVEKYWEDKYAES